MRIILPIITILILFACEKSEDRSCFKAVGGETSKEIPLGGFNQLYLGPHLKYVLIQSNEEKVVLYGGENLLNFIETTVEGGKLSIRNKNQCNFLRSYDKVVTVQIYLKDVINVLFEGTHELYCHNTLNLGDLTFVIRDGAGAVDLDLNAQSLHTIVTHGWGNFTLRGQVGYLKLEINSNGFGSTYNMNVSDSLHVISNSSELVKVNADNCSFRAQTISSGDIWYIGVPSFLEFYGYGSGNLIDKN